MYLVTTIVWLSLLRKFCGFTDVKEFMQWELILKYILLASHKMFYMHARLAHERSSLSSYPDGECRNHMGVAHSYCYKQ